MPEGCLARPALGSDAPGLRGEAGGGGTLWLQSMTADPSSSELHSRNHRQLTLSTGLSLSCRGRASYSKKLHKNAFTLQSL